MQKQTRGLLTELDELLSHRDHVNIIEGRASNIIAGAINLINHIKETYSDEVAGELERRLLNSIRTQDPNKFIRGIRRVKDED